MNALVIDTETHPIGPGAVVPKVVSFAAASRAAAGDEQVILRSAADPDFDDAVRESFRGHDAQIVGQNVAYDLAVICQHMPEIESHIWDLLEDCRITDTMIREMLLNLSTHGKLDMIEMPDGSTEKLSYSLEALVKGYFGVEQMEDAWRRNFDLLDGRPSAEWPEDARLYAEDDALWTLRVYEAQARRVRSVGGPASLNTEHLHTAAHFALFCMTARGMATDPEEYARVRAMLDAELAPERMALLIRSGILRPGEGPRPHTRMLAKALALDPARQWEGSEAVRADLEAQGIKFTAAVKPSIDRKLLEDLVQKTCEANRLPCRTTPAGGVCTDREVIATLSEKDPVLSQYEKRQALQKIVSTELPRMEWEGKLSPVVHFNYRPLLETGRSSSFGGDLYPSGNGQQVDPRVRPCFVPRPGYLLCSCDYQTLELVTTAQVTYDLFGRSVHRDKINAKYDLHAYLGSQLALHLDREFGEFCRGQDADTVYRTFLECKAKDAGEQANGFYRNWRKFAKPVGLGFPGGLGPQKIVTMARRNYDVDLEDAASRMDAADLERDEAVMGPVLRYARRLRGLTDDSQFRWDRELRGLALAARLRNIWLATYPEMVAYFRYVAERCKDSENPVVGVRDGEPIQGLCYSSLMGMYRAGATFTAVANGMCMQTPAAEGAKMACVLVTRACRDSSRGSILYGAHPVDFIHDEILSEVEESRAHEQAHEVARLMVEAMRHVVTDVDVRAQPALMRRWYKEAEPVYVDDRLMPWEPKAD